MPHVMTQPKRTWNLQRETLQRRRSDIQDNDTSIESTPGQSSRHGYDTQIKLKTMFYTVSLQDDHILIESKGMHGSSGHITIYIGSGIDAAHIYNLPVIPHNAPKRQHVYAPREDSNGQERKGSCYLIRRASKHLELHVRSGTGYVGRGSHIDFGYPEMESLLWQAFLRTRSTVEQLLIDARMVEQGFPLSLNPEHAAFQHDAQLALDDK